MLSLLNDQGIEYVYIGQLQGRQFSGGSSMYSAEELLQNPKFENIYHRDLVWIFKVWNNA